MANKIKLRKQGTDPETNPNETYQLTVDGKTLHHMNIKWRVGRNDSVEKEEKFKSAAEAVAALQREADRLKAAGFVDMAAAAAAPPPKPAASKPGTPAAKPKWLKAPPDALANNLKKLQANAKKAGLDHRFEEISALMKPGIDLILKKAKPADLKKVVSRIGGDPDLPKGFTWPTLKKAPLVFVGQIVIDEVKEHDLEGLLPKAGVLSFFAQLDPTAPEYGDRCVVTHFPSAKDLVRTAAPEGGGLPAKSPGLLSPKPRLTVPPSEDPVIEKLKLTSDEKDHYHDDVFRGPIPEGRHHMLLGWPTAATHHGIKGKRFIAQFDSDHHIHFEMGDYNTLRFYIDGDAINEKTLATAVCTLSEA